MILTDDLQLGSVAVADATGTARGAFPSLALGQEAWITRIAITGGSATGTARFYRWSEANGLMAVAPIADLNTDDLSNPIVIPPMTPLVWVADAAVGAAVTVTIYGEVRSS